MESTDPYSSTSESDDENGQKSTPTVRKKVSKQCYMHLTSVKKEKVQDFTKTRWNTYRNCVERWLNLPGESRTIAETYKHCVDIEFGDAPGDAGFHATCYRRFIDTKRMNAAEKQTTKSSAAQDVVAGESELTEHGPSTSESPRKKLRSRTGLPASAGPVLPVLCIICKKIDKYSIVKGKRQRDHLTLAETLSAGQLLKAAQMKQDTSILLHIQDKDCVALEVRYHKTCYRDYTRFLTKSTATSTGTLDETEAGNEPHFDVSYKIFCENVIRQRIIVNQEVLKMNHLRKLFCNTVKTHEDRDASSYRQDKLKRRLSRDFPQLVFHSPSKRNICELVFVMTLSADTLIDNLPQPETSESTEIDQLFAAQTSSDGRVEDTLPHTDTHDEDNEETEDDDNESLHGPPPASRPPTPQMFGEGASNSSSTGPPFQRRKPTSKASAKEREEKLELEKLSILKRLAENATIADEDDMFGKQVATEMWMIKDPHLKLQLRRSISNMLYDAQERCMSVPSMYPPFFQPQPYNQQPHPPPPPRMSFSRMLGESLDQESDGC